MLVSLSKHTVSSTFANGQLSDAGAAQSRIGNNCQPARRLGHFRIGVTSAGADRAREKSHGMC
jgi:hypothetical protein